MLNPNAYLFTQQQQQAPQFKPIANPNPGEWYNPYLELGQGYYQPDSEVKEDDPAAEIEAEVKRAEEDNTDEAFMPFGNTKGYGLGRPFDPLKPGAGLDFVRGLGADLKRFGTQTAYNFSDEGRQNFYDRLANDPNRQKAKWGENYVDERGDVVTKHATWQDFKDALAGKTTWGGKPIEEEDNSDPQPTGGGTVWENPGSNVGAGNTDRGFTTGGWNTGGMPMRNPMIAYRQVGGPATPPPQGAPIEPTAPVPPAPAAPQAPTTPPPVPRVTFAEKVAQAKAILRGEMGLGGETHQMPDGSMMEGAQHAPADGQGDSGILDPGGIFEPSQSELGPDMAFQDGTGATIGADDIDGHLPEGAMVMNPEASEMFAEELQAMAMGGMAHGRYQ